MLSFNNDFLGYHPKEHNVEFSGTDTAELFEKNLKLQPEDWYYRTNKIYYDRNSNGHRCKEINDIDLDNYILYTGCSNTEGIGLALNNTYAYLLSNWLKMDYYNLAIGGTGIDVVNYNLNMWFSKVKKPPKLLILQWPHYNRFTAKNFQNLGKHIPEPWDGHGFWSTLNTNNKNHKDIGNFLISGEDIGYFKSLKILTRNLAHNITSCPIIELTNAADASYDDVTGIVDALKQNEYKLRKIDDARDIRPKDPKLRVFGHSGIKSEQVNAAFLYTIANKLLNITNKVDV